MSCFQSHKACIVFIHWCNLLASITMYIDPPLRGFNDIIRHALLRTVTIPFTAQRNLMAICDIFKGIFYAREFT